VLKIPACAYTQNVIDSYFIGNSTSIFCGDEPKTLNNDWMLDHSTHLPKNISDYAEYESKFGAETLLICGVSRKQRSDIV
jgi:hypothetical protein